MNNQLIRGNLFLFSKPEPESKQFEKGERFFLIRQERLKVYLLFCG